MKKIYIILFIFLPKVIFASTIVPDVVEDNVYWDSKNSPYIINSDAIIKGDLRIGSGVVVQLGDAYIYSLKVLGNLSIEGEKDKPVIFEGLENTNKHWFFDIRSKTANIKNAIFRNSDIGMAVRGGSAVFDSVKIENLGSCMSIENGSVIIASTSISGCRYSAIYGDNSHIDVSNSELLGDKEIPGIVLDKGDINISSTSIKSFSNALLVNNSVVDIEKSKISDNITGLSIQFSDVKVSSTSFTKNTTAVSSFEPVIFQGGEGNYSAPTDSISIHDSEFLDSIKFDITNNSKNPVDATNNWWGNNEGPKKNQGEVLVYPWIKRDYNCCSNVLFIPGFEGSRLFLPDNQLWEPNRNDDVKKLMLDNKGKSLNDVSVGGVIDKGFGLVKIYDSFIKSMDGLVASGTIQSWQSFPYDWRLPVTSIAKDLVPIIESNASTSQTKKVTIISHSNGGLVTKALIKELKDLGKENLVDSLVFIAVPHIGTPKTIAALQYAYDQQLFRGLILNKMTARQFGYNLASAYGLLPVDFLPTIGGVSSTSKDMKKPMALNSYLLEQAKNIHSIIDSIDFPKIFSITGWNIPTLNSLNTQTLLGDGTVVSKSSDFFGNSFFFDIANFNKDKKKNISHADITESNAVLGLVKDIVASTTENKIYYDKYISKDKPIVDDSKYQNLVIKFDSSMSMGAYDSEGRHTGPAIDQSKLEKELDIEQGLGTFVDEEIPNSSYDELIDKKRIFLDRDNSYTLKGQGLEKGNATLQINLMDLKGKEKPIGIFKKIPIDKNTKIELKIDKKINTLRSLNIDTNGDGKFDKTIKPVLENIDQETN